MEWITTDSLNGCNLGKKIAHDSEGNLYVATNSYLLNYGVNYEGLQKIIKYNAKGNQIWTYDFRALDTVCSLVNIFIDQEDALICVGTCGTYGGFVQKIDKNGNRKWINKPNKQYIYTTAVLDEEGSIYVEGWEMSKDSLKILVIAIDKNGMEKWKNIYYSPHIYFINAQRNMTISPQGNIIITGQSTRINKMWLIKYDRNGKIILEKEVAYTQDSAMYLIDRGIVCDNNENIYIIISADSQTRGLSLWGDEGAILAFDKNGKEKWSHYYCAEKQLLPTRITLDKEQNLYMMGSIVSDPDDYATRIGYLSKYSINGELIWETTVSYGQVNNGYAVLQDMFINPKNEIYLTGESIGATFLQYKELFVAKFNIWGDALWYSTAGGELNVEPNQHQYARDFGMAITVDNDNNVYATGSFTIGNSVQDARGVCAVMKVANPKELVKWAVTAYPNPFSSQVNFQFNLPEAGEVNLIIWNLVGEKVYETTQTFWEGKNMLDWQPNQNMAEGFYFFELSSGKEISKGKILYQR